MSVIRQDILLSPQTLKLHHVSADEAARQLSRLRSESATDDLLPIGIAYHVSRKGQADFICLAQPNDPDILLIPLLEKSKFSAIKNILCAEGSARYCLVGFGMPQIAIQVSHATKLPIKGVDLLTLAGNPRTTSHPLTFITEKIGNILKKSAVQRLWIGTKATAKNDTALQAWLAACAADRCKLDVMKAVRLDTRHLTPSESACLSLSVIQSDLLQKIKPREVENDFTTSLTGFTKQGKFQIHNARFKTRIRRSEQTVVVMTDKNHRQFEGTATSSKGKTTNIRLKEGKKPNGHLRNVKVGGLPEPTNAESYFIKRLWFPSVSRTRIKALNPHQQSLTPSVPLNDSQRTAMRAMVSELPIVIVHGPPGTGKTTTITAAAQVWESRRFPVWILAHSNVAVKNIAEKLLVHNVNFKLLVSREFFEEWHEHLYESMTEKLIRSDEFPKNKVGMARLLLDSKVILCTLSMILNPALFNNNTFDIVPPRCLLIDEASQISVFEFMRLPNMKTIFDFDHLNRKKDTYFLDTQYRMPIPIAKFISEKVYEGRLLSEHKIDLPDCLAFIDVPRTGERPAGTSTENLGEVQTVVHLVRHYYCTGFCVITPYDAQRAVIQKELKAQNLPWESVYNVDSFQGNEADYVILSLVRSTRQGFLSSIRRMNVLLTRCKQGLIIVSSKDFLGPGGKGFDTLVGKLVEHWRSQYGHTWINWRFVADGSVDLPGFIRTKRSQPHGKRRGAKLSASLESEKSLTADNLYTVTDYAACNFMLVKGKMSHMNGVNSVP